MPFFLIAGFVCFGLWIAHLIWLILDMEGRMHTWVDHGGDFLAAAGFAFLYLQDHSFVFLPAVIGYFALFSIRLFAVQCGIYGRSIWFWKNNNQS